MKQSILHVLYTGEPNGGAQTFAVKLAREMECDTSTVIQGGLSHRLASNGLRYITFGAASQRLADYHVVILSDLRCLLIGFAVIFLLKRYRGKLIFLPHSDKLIKYRLLIKCVTYIANIKIFPTTHLQAKAFTSSEIWYRIFDLKELRKPNSRQAVSKEILFFGRFSRVKNLDYLIETFKETKLSDLGYTLTLIGGEEWGGGHKSIQFVPWLEPEMLFEKLKNARFVINATEFEGISLQVIEGIQNGLYPLLYSIGLASNLGLTRHDHVFQNAIELRRIVLSNNKFDSIKVLNKLSSGRDIFVELASC